MCGRPIPAGGELRTDGGRGERQKVQAGILAARFHGVGAFVEASEVVEGDLRLRTTGETRRGVVVEIAQQAVAQAFVRDSAQLLLDALHGLRDWRVLRVDA